MICSEGDFEGLLPGALKFLFHFSNITYIFIVKPVGL